MSRVKTFDSTGVAPGGRLFAGDLNQIQDQYADLVNYSQTHGVGALAIGEAGLTLVRFGAGDARITGAFRADGIIRGLGGLYGGAFTTAQRNAIPSGFRPYGLIILNTDANRYEWNQGTDASPSWQPISPPIPAGSITSTELGTDSVGSDEIIAGAVAAPEISATLKPSGSAAAGTEALRAIGSGAGNVIAGNDSRLSVGAAGVATVRALGTGATDAAAGNDGRLSDQRVPTDNSVSTVKLQNAAVTSPKIATPGIDAKGGSYTLVASDRYKMIRMDGGGTLFIPTDASEAFNIGDSVDIIQWGGAQVNVAAANGGVTTVVGNPGLKLIGQYAMASAIKIGANVWLVAGGLTP